MSKLIQKKHLSSPTQHGSMVMRHFKCQSNLYGPVNPNGYINFGTAESTVTYQAPLIQRWLRKYSIPTNILSYNYFYGTLKMREKISKWLQTKGVLASPHSNIICVASASSAISHTCQILNQMTKTHPTQTLRVATSEKQLQENWQNPAVKFVIFSLKTPLDHFGILLVKDNEQYQQLISHAIFAQPSTLSQHITLPMKHLHYFEIEKNLLLENSILPTFSTMILKKFVHPHESTIASHQLYIFSGTTTALESLSKVLLKPNDRVGIPTPYYAGFDSIFDHSKMIIQPYTGSWIPEKILDWACAHEIRALVITNPNNPDGVKWTPLDVKKLASLAQKKHIHIIFDEIYFGVNSTTPTSPLTALSCIKNNTYIHVVQGFSKNFGLPGLRVGWVVTQNPIIKKTLNKLQETAFPSTSTQRYLCQLFKSTQNVEQDFFSPIFKLRWNLYKHLTKNLRIRNIPYTENYAEGVFVLIDLSKYVHSFEEEQTFAQKLFDQKKLLITPGSSFHCSRPGIFRICYAQSKSEIDTFFHRMDQMLSLQTS